MEKGSSNAILRIASILIFFGIWQLSSIFLQVDLLPGPQEVYEKIIIEAGDDELVYHTLITLKRVFLSFIIAMFIGTFLGFTWEETRDLIPS